MRIRGSIVVLAVLAIAWGSVLVDPGPNQNAHMATVTALAHGTARIDRYHNWTRDTAYVGGHYYAAKAPGLALATLPWYFVLEGAGLLVHGTPPSIPWPAAETLRMPPAAPWEFALWGSLLPFFGLLLLVRRVTDDLVPGTGTVTAVTLGAGSLVAVFATMFFDHELSAFVGFLSFALLYRERAGQPSLRRVAVGGVVAGLATVVEFPLLLLAVLLGVYTLSRDWRLSRAVTYGASVAVGLLPLAVYDLWAYGTVGPANYAHAVINPGRNGHDVLGANASGFFGLGVPSPQALTQLLLEPKGLLILAPVWALAAVGLVVLGRGGRRAEALLAGAAGAVFLLYDAGYYLPFGGFNSGPRFLVPMLPFLALGLAAAWRALPGPTLVLAAASVVVTTVSILANPMIVSEDVGTMFHRLEHGGDQNGPLPWTILHWVWGAKVAPLLIVGAVVAIAVLSAFAPFARRLNRRDIALGVAALVAWRIAYVGGTILARAPHGWDGAATLAMTLAATVTLLVYDRRFAALPGVALTFLVWPAFAAHTRIALAAISLTLIAIVVAACAPRARAASTAAR